MLRNTSELDSEDMPSLDATRSTLRVDAPHTYISCTTAATEVSTRDQRASMSSGYRGTTRIDKSYHRFCGRDVITDPKTPKSIRTIKPSTLLVEDIADYFKRHPEIGPNDRMFTVTKYQISRAMKNGCQKSRVKKIRVHDLRHSHVSLLIDKGFAALAIVERMGHEATDITFRYTHLFLTVQEDLTTRSMMREEDSKCPAPITAGSGPSPRRSA